ncbi:MAG: hypothetical protein EOP83_37475 [Verrucomicrobiaceae bacterium]|nr:MAG: hypothetical protein EOP83_37475 [Verrucomicrobiaceae bacterium]
MPLRRFIARLMLCMAFMLASSYAQAMVHVDDFKVSTTAQLSKPKLPPCHHAMKADGDKERGGHHNGCCSNFACAVGLISETPMMIPRCVVTTHDIDYGTVKHSASTQPLNPPPKSN